MRQNNFPDLESSSSEGSLNDGNFHYRKKVQVSAPQNNFSKSIKITNNSSVFSSKERSQKPESRKRILSVLEGKATTVWIFVISAYIQEEHEARIRNIYKKFGNSMRQELVPLYSKCSQIASFLSLPNTTFKIVSDIKNIQQVIEFSIEEEQIVEIYIYNEKGDDGFTKAIQAKEKTYKVKGIFMDLEEIVQRAQDDVDNDLSFYNSKDVKLRRRQKIFPSFILLSGTDKTKATLYRGNLYAARKLSDSERKAKLQNFLALIQEKYLKDQTEHGNIAKYVNLNKKHSVPVTTKSQAKDILSFYTCQSFYYKVLNSMLRTLKTPKQFSPCILPFNQTYNSIKYFYREKLHKNNRKIAPMTLYRGGRLNRNDLNKIRQGVYIQMFGFMSTSSEEKIAQGFKDRNKTDGIFFKIHVPQMTIHEKYDHYDHGFVDINENGIGTGQFSSEKEVLFNALNIYKVLKKKDENGVPVIQLEYGSIFKLLQKKSTLNPQEKQVLTNYQYCAEMLSKVEDEGDAFVLHNELDEAEQYYQQNLNEQKNFYKLANVQHLKGNLAQANQNAEKSLEMELKNLDEYDKEKCMKVCSIHTKVAKIKLDKEDFLTAEDHITKALELLPKDEQTFEKAEKFRQRGEIRFKKGDVVNSERDFSKSEKALSQLLKETKEKGFDVKFQYFVNFITLPFREKTKNQLDEWYDKEIEQVKKNEEDISEIQEKIFSEHMKVNQALRKVANYVEDKKKYKTYVQKGKKYLLELQGIQTNDPNQKAKIKVMEATIEGCLNLVESESLLKQAIDLIEKKEPFHENVGKYSEILADIQHQYLERFNNPQDINEGEKIKYDENEHNQTYKKCKRNFEKAIKIMEFHKSKGSPDVLSIKNKVCSLDFSESNYSECEKIIKEATESVQNKIHTQVAKSTFLLAKIALSRGQLKLVFEKIKEAKEVLKGALVQQKSQKYLNVYRCHDLYLESKHIKARVFIQQVNHDMSLKQLNCAEYFLKKKMEGDQYHTLFPQLYELKAESFCQNQKAIYDIDDYFQKAISLRESHHGKWNVANASTYCNFAKYLFTFDDPITAEQYIHKALEIYSCFDSEHPITYKVLFINGMLKIRKGNKEEGLSDMKKCLYLIGKKYDETHMIFTKTKYQYAKELCDAGQIQKGIEQLLSLQSCLDISMEKSLSRQKISSDLDDQKVGLKRLMYETLKQSYEGQKKSSNIKRCQIQLGALRKSYRFTLWK